MPKRGGRRSREGVGLLTACSNSCLTIFFLFTVLSDLAVNVCFYLLAHDWKWDAHFYRHISNFTHDVVDLLLLYIIRMVAYALFSYVVFVFANPKSLNDRLQEQNEKDLMGGIQTQCEPVGESHRARLLVHSSEDETEDPTKKLETLKWKRNFIFLTLFLLGTFFQAYTGIKCVEFEFSHGLERKEAICFGCIVFLINLELWILKSLLQAKTEAEEGLLQKEIHKHPLIQKDIRGHWCDVCRKRIQDKAWNCKQCNWDICQFCMKKKLKILKGEKAKVNRHKAAQHEEMGTCAYIRRGFSLLCDHWVLWTTGMVGLLINTAAALIMPNYTGRIIDQVFQQNRDKFKEDLYYFLVLSIVQGLFGSFTFLCFRVAGGKIVQSIRDKLFAQILIQDIAFFDKNTTGELTSKIMNDVGAMTSPIRTFLQTLVKNIIYLFGGLIMCFYTSWRLSILAFTTMAPIIYITREYAIWSKRLWTKVWASWAKSNEVATESITNVRTVRAFTAEDYQINRFKTASKDAVDTLIKNVYGNTLSSTLSNYLDLAAGVLILWYGGTVAMNVEEGDSDSTLTPGKLVTFQLYWNMINNAYQGLQNILTSFTTAAGAAERVFSLMDSLPLLDPKAGLDPQQLRGEIELKDVHFSYPLKAKKVLHGIDLHIKPGQVVAFVGRSGAGKSTLINLLMRFYDPDQGSVFFDGVDIREYAPIKLRAQIGVVQQNTDIFSGTVAANIAYGKDEWDHDALVRAATMAHALEFIEELDEGFDTEVGERGTRLSGGQKQRLAIARMLFRDPTILLLDEATSSLDTESEAFVQKALDDLVWGEGKKTRTIILVAHRLSTVINADQIAVVDGGKIVECGNHDELVKQEGIYHKLVSRQIQRQNNQLPEDAGVIDKIDDLLDNLEGKKDAEDGPEKIGAHESHTKGKRKGGKRR